MTSHFRIFYIFILGFNDTLLYDLNQIFSNMPILKKSIQIIKVWPKSIRISEFRFNPFSKFQPFFIFFTVLIYGEPSSEVRFLKPITVLKIEKIVVC